MPGIEENTSNQYLTFTLGDDFFALDIGMVREVLEVTNITRIPRTPGFMRGVLNLRGNAVPVVDMRLKFGLHAKDDTVDTCVIIVEVVLDNETALMGAVADSVHEVLEIPVSQLGSPPKMGTAIDPDFIKGMSKHGEGFVMLLDVSKVFSIEELTFLKDSKTGALTTLATLLGGEGAGEAAEV